VRLSRKLGGLRSWLILESSGSFATFAVIRRARRGRLGFLPKNFGE
jgi:hypothetical protein